MGKIKIIIISISAIIFITVSVFYLISKNTKKIEKNEGQRKETEKVVTAKEPIYDVVILPYEAPEGGVNPYCEVKISNFKNGQVSEVSLEYVIEVSSNDEEELPEYYWSNSAGEELGTKLSGELGSLVEETDSYIITFINAGDLDITRSVLFTTSASQK